MLDVGKFYKVTQVQYVKDRMAYVDIARCEAEKEYLNIKRPQRSTKRSAGYDFYAPFDCTIKAGESMMIPTGIQWFSKQNISYVLQLYPRSSLGFKYGLRFLNTIPVIDADYCDAENQGHIMLKFTVDKDLEIHAGDRLVQGIFLKYGLTEDDAADGSRFGGMGSTGV